jgi:hypothetical protein
MILSGNSVLSSVRFSELVLDYQERFARRRPLRFLDRTPLVPSEDDEIRGTFRGEVFAADLVADDQPAAVYSAGHFDLVTAVIPNIKIGRRLGQATINRLNRIRQNVGTEGDRRIFGDWQSDTAGRVVDGVREQMNALICAMQIDALNYNRGGIIISNATWGMPAAYKVTPSTLWTNTAATPITDILTLKAYAADTDGEMFDRVTIPTGDLINAFATTEFKQSLAGLFKAGIGTTAVNTRDPKNRQYLQDILEMDIEVDDKTITVQTDAGAKSTGRVLPLGKVILSSKADDNNQAAMFFGNGVVTESIVAGIIGGPAEISGERFGPVGYYTGPPQLNPPNLTAWGVGRGFPVKQRVTATAVLTVR